MKLKLKEIILFSILSAMLFGIRIAMAILPNIHLVGILIAAFTITFRSKALWIVYGYVFLEGILAGFAPWWVPYLYIWTVLWGATMLLPKKMPKTIAPIVYMVVCSMHGFLFGTLYAPLQAIMFGLNYEGMIAWIIAGLPFDIIHGISNFLCGTLIYPIILLFNKINKSV